MSDTTLGRERHGARFDDVDSSRWVAVCPIDLIVPDSGVAALVDGRQVAVFRFGDDGLFALGNHDPFSGANVLARGILGDQAGIPFVSSPIFKQRFDLRSGACLTDPEVRVSVHGVCVVGGTVHVSVHPRAPDVCS